MLHCKMPCYGKHNVISHSAGDRRQHGPAGDINPDNPTRKKRRYQTGQFRAVHEVFYTEAKQENKQQVATESNNGVHNIEVS